MAVAEHRGSVMACELHVIVNDPGERTQFGRAVELLDHLEALWSRFLADSDVSRLNRGAGTPVAVAPETIELVEAMTSGWDLTQGGYDPTILPILVAGGYAASRIDPTAITVLPGGPHRIGAMAEIIVDRQRSTITLPRGVAIDPGGIGKGFAADAAVALLLDDGAAGALVGIGGDLVAGGTAPDDGWRIDIEWPDPTHAPLCRVMIDHGGVATSSSRSRRWEHEGQPRHHVIDPATGAPSDSDLAAVTVFSTSGWRAEAFATAALLVGSDAVLAHLDSHELTGLAVTETGEVLRTSDLDTVEITDLDRTAGVR